MNKERTFEEVRQVKGKNVPKTMWCFFWKGHPDDDQEAWPLTTEQQVTAAQEEMRVRGLTERRVFTVTDSGSDHGGFEVVECGKLYSDVNGLVVDE